MGAKSGFALKLLQWFIRGVQFCCAALILAVYSYFLATLANHKLPITTQLRAVEGISGAALLYAIVGLLLLCCLAGFALTSFLSMVLDVAFIGAFVYVAVANKNGASDCKGYLDTPFGRGSSAKTVEQGEDGFTVLPSYHLACKLQSACLAVAIIGIVFYILSILMEVALVRHHRKEKRFGPSPHNNYTSGYPTKGNFFKRLFRRNTTKSTGDNVLPAHTTPDQLDTNRQSYGTERTAVNTDPGYNKYETGYGYQTGVGPASPYPQAGLQSGVQGGSPPQTYAYNDGIYNRA